MVDETEAGHAARQRRWQRRAAKLRAQRSRMPKHGQAYKTVILQQLAKRARRKGPRGKQ